MFFAGVINWMHIPEGLVDQFGGKFCRGLQPLSHTANIFAIVVVSSLWCVLKQGFAFLLKLYLFSFVSCFVWKCCETAKIGCTQHQFSFIIITVIICVITIVVIIWSRSQFSPKPPKLYFQQTFWIMLCIVCSFRTHFSYFSAVEFWSMECSFLKSKVIDPPISYPSQPRTRSWKGEDHFSVSPFHGASLWICIPHILNKKF